jgi:hypothetical protein
MHNRVSRILWLFFVFILPLIWVSISCSTVEQDLSDEITPLATVSEPEIKFEGQGVGYSIRAWEGKTWETYQIRVNSSFRGFYRLLNQKPAEEYLLTCLVDYRQVPCDFDGQRQLLYKVSMEDFEERLIPFETPLLPSGFHDLALFAFAKPGVHDMSRDYRLSTDFNYLYAPRAVLLVGDEPWQAPEQAGLITATQPLNYPLSGLVVNREDQPAEIRAWLTDTVKAGEIIDFVIHMGNKVEPHTAAVMAFLDYKQIPIDGAEQWVSFVMLPNNTYVALPGRFRAPSEPGVYEFMVVSAHNPFHMLEDPPLGPERTSTQMSSLIESSIRVALIVED